MKYLKHLNYIFITILSVLIISSCSITGPINATGNEIGHKVGYSRGTVVFGVAFDVDVSIASAAKQGGITKISTVEFKHSTILYLFNVYTCIVTGE